MNDTEFFWFVVDLMLSSLTVYCMRRVLGAWGIFSVYFVLVVLGGFLLGAFHLGS